MSRPVERWLGTFMCSQYSDTFEAHGYKTLQSVCQLDHTQLQSMGVMAEHHNKIMENVSVLQQSYNGASSAAMGENVSNEELSGNHGTTGQYDMNIPESIQHNYIPQGQAQMGIGPLQHQGMSNYSLEVQQSITHGCSDSYNNQSDMYNSSQGQYSNHPPPHQQSYNSTNQWSADTGYGSQTIHPNFRPQHNPSSLPNPGHNSYYVKQEVGSPHQQGQNSMYNSVENAHFTGTSMGPNRENIESSYASNSYQTMSSSMNNYSYCRLAQSPVMMHNANRFSEPQHSDQYSYQSGLHRMSPSSPMSVRSPVSVNSSVPSASPGPMGMCGPERLSCSSGPPSVSSTGVMIEMRSPKHQSLCSPDASHTSMRSPDNGVQSPSPGRFTNSVGNLTPGNSNYSYHAHQQHTPIGDYTGKVQATLQAPGKPCHSSASCSTSLSQENTYQPQFPGPPQTVPFNPLQSLQKLVMLSDSHVVDPKSVVNDANLMNGPEEIIPPNWQNNFEHKRLFCSDGKHCGTDVEDEFDNDSMNNLTLLSSSRRECYESKYTRANIDYTNLSHDHINSSVRVYSNQDFSMRKDYDAVAFSESGWISDRQGSAPMGRAHSGNARGSSRSRSSSPRGRESSPRGRAYSPRSRGSSPRARGSSPRARGSSPRARGSSPRARGSPPRARGSSPRARGSSPRARGSSPRGRGSSPRARGYSPRSRGSSPRTRGSSPRAGGSSPRSGESSPRSGESSPRARGSSPISRCSYARGRGHLYCPEEESVSLKIEDSSNCSQSSFIEDSLLNTLGKCSPQFESITSIEETTQLQDDISTKNENMSDEEATFQRNETNSLMKRHCFSPHREKSLNPRGGRASPRGNIRSPKKGTSPRKRSASPGQKYHYIENISPVREMPKRSCRSTVNGFYNEEPDNSPERRSPRLSLRSKDKLAVIDVKQCTVQLENIFHDKSRSLHNDASLDAYASPSSVNCMDSGVISDVGRKADTSSISKSRNDLTKFDLGISDKFVSSDGELECKQSHDSKFVPDFVEPEHCANTSIESDESKFENCATEEPSETPYSLNGSVHSSAEAHHPINQTSLVDHNTTSHKYESPNHNFSPAKSEDKIEPSLETRSGSTAICTEHVKNPLQLTSLDSHQGSHSADNDSGIFNGASPTNSSDSPAKTSDKENPSKLVSKKVKRHRPKAKEVENYSTDEEVMGLSNRILNKRGRKSISRSPKLSCVENRRRKFKARAIEELAKKKRPILIHDRRNYNSIPNMNCESRMRFKQSKSLLDFVKNNNNLAIEKQVLTVAPVHISESPSKDDKAVLQTNTDNDEEQKWSSLPKDHTASLSPMKGTDLVSKPVCTLVISKSVNEHKENTDSSFIHAESQNNVNKATNIILVVDDSGKVKNGDDPVKAGILPNDNERSTSCMENDASCCEMKVEPQELSPQNDTPLIGCDGKLTDDSIVSTPGTVVDSPKKKGRPRGSKNSIPWGSRTRKLKKNMKQDREFDDLFEDESIKGLKKACGLLKKKDSKKKVHKKNLDCHRSPFLRIQGQKNMPATTEVVNLKHVEQERSTNKIYSKESCIDPNSDVLSKISLTGPWLCTFCGKCSNYNSLGDLHGPYFFDSLHLHGPKSHHDIHSGPSSITKRHSPATKGRDSKLLTVSTPVSQGKQKVRPKSLTPVKDVHTSKYRRTSLESTKSVEGKPTVEVWLHEDCLVWTSGVFAMGGKMHGLEEAVNEAKKSVCSVCKSVGATLGCFQKSCNQKFHYICAVEKDCWFDEENFSLLCVKHKDKKLKAYALPT